MNDALLPPVVLVRHGRTSWNRTRFLGRRDVPLDEVGRGQAAAAADAVRTLLGPGGGAVTLWSSPLGRARETAAPVADRPGPIRCSRTTPNSAWACVSPPTS